MPATQPEVPQFDRTPEVDLSDETPEIEGSHGLTLRLPCGALMPDGTLHRDIEIHELTGAEEDILANRKFSQVEAINRVITSITSRLGALTRPPDIGAAVQHLRYGDRSYLNVQMRRMSLGDNFRPRVTCPACRVESEYEIDLSTLKKREMPDPSSNQRQITLPSGRIAVVRVLTLLDDKQVAQIAQQHTEDLASASLHLRVVSIDDKRMVSPLQLQELSMRDRAAIRLACRDMDGGIETRIDFSCSSCGAAFAGELPTGDTAFFYPSGID